jgi:uncharacterized protein (TIGR03663 family)
VRANSVCIVLVILTAVGALAFRLPSLSSRVFHGDEANQAFKAGILLEAGEYRYDPLEHHGPTLYYLARISTGLSGVKTFAETSESMYRIVPVLFGAAVVLLLLLIRDGLGNRAVFYAALLTAVSPAMVYYSRYFIQEMLLVFFTLAAIATGWRYAQSRRVGWAIACGAALGLMHATKETCVLAYAAMVIALVSVIWWERRGSAQDTPWWKNVKHVHVALGCAVAAVISVVLFSSFFSHARGPLDSILTYVTYLQRAEGEGSSASHAKPWYYYLSLLAYTKYAPGPWWSEGMILALAAVGYVRVFVLRGEDDGVQSFQRFVGIYTLVLTIAYALIAYKTPWSMLSFLHGLILMAGIGAAGLIHGPKRKPLQVLACVVLAWGAVHLCVQAVRANGDYAADPRNPYAYGHTSWAIARLAERAEGLAAVHPDGYDMPVLIVAPNHDYWPIPWYLRRFSAVAYVDDIPSNLDAPFILATPDLHARLEPLLPGHLREGHGLRPAVFMSAYIDRGLWDEYLAAQSP